MDKLDVIEKIINGRNTTVIVGIVSIVALVAIDLVTGRDYKVTAAKESVTVEPAKAE